MSTVYLVLEPNGTIVFIDEYCCLPCTIKRRGCMFLDGSNYFTSKPPRTGNPVAYAISGGRVYPFWSIPNAIASADVCLTDHSDLATMLLSNRQN